MRDLTAGEPYNISFILHQNYPNPFNLETVISYKFLKKDFVQLVTYDISGQKFVTLVKDINAVGLHKIKWDGKNNLGKEVSSGIYLYELKSQHYRKVKKMIFLR